MASQFEDAIMAEELRVIASEQASDNAFSNQGLLTPSDEGIAMGADDLRAKRRIEENDERMVRRRLEHEAWEKQMEEARLRIPEVEEDAGQVDQGCGAGRRMSWRRSERKCFG